MNTNRQILFDQSTTTGTHFCRVPWINLYARSTSFFRFVNCELHKLSPGNIRDISVHAAPVPVHHVNNIQFLKCYYTKTVHQFTTELVRKVSTFVSNAVIYMGQYPSSLISLRCSFLGFTQFTLRSCESLFLFTEEARVGNLLAVRVCSEIGDPYIYTDCCINLWKWLQFDLARKASVPITNSIPYNSQPLDFAFYRTMEIDFHTPDLGQMKSIVIQKIKAALGICKTIISKLPPESWVARLLSTLDATKESFKRKINTSTCFLQTLRISIIQKLMLSFPAGNHFDGVISGDGGLVFLPRVLSISKRFVVNPATGIKRPLQSRSL